MKKLMILAAFAAATVAASAAEIRTPEEIRGEYAALTNQTDRTAFARAIVTDEWRAMCDYILETAGTDLVKAQRFANGAANFGPNVFHALSWYDAAKPLAAEYDAKFAAAGLHSGYIGHYAMMPLCTESYIKKFAIDETMPATVAAVRKYGKASSLSDFTLGERLNLCAEAGASPKWVPYGSLTTMTKNMLAAAPGAIKRRLRETGRSFVAKEGEENPVQKPLDELSAALNAPKMAGLAAWVKEWCPDHKWIEPKWMTDAELKVLEDAVYYGERNFGLAERCMLQAHLGIEAYNAFVEKYNGTVEK